MPYTRVWDPDTPLGTEDADLIDDWIRDKLLDIQERLNDIIGADSDMFQDPVVDPGYDLTSLYNAAKSIPSVERTIPWYAGDVQVAAGTLVRTINRLVLTGASADMSALIPVVLPVGVTITTLRVRVRANNASHTVTAQFKGTRDDTDIFTSTMAAPSVSTSPQWIAPASAPSHVTEADTMYGFYVRLENNNVDTSNELRLYSAQIKFTSPSAGVR